MLPFSAKLAAGPEASFAMAEEEKLPLHSYIVIWEP